ncbi:MAG: tyrosinase family protein, partial [Betaproteobacteria bacterium]
MKPGPQANAVFGYLKADEYFQHEGVVCSDDGFYTLRLNQYGQLEIWFKADGEARAIWLSSYSSSDRSYFAIMQGDGNFCVYKGTGPGRNEGLVWDARKTAAWGTNRLTLWSDGNLQLINVVAGQPITVAWETGAHDNVPHPPTRIRRNIGSSEELLFDFVRGVKMLKEIGAYDRYIRRHRDLARGSPPVIHLTPCFLPWHRLFLLDFERDMQRVLGDDTFALPYWDWTDDYGLPSHIGPLWDWDRLGGAGNPVVSGPFAFPQWHVIEDVDIKLIRGLGLPGVTDRFADKRAVRNLFALNDFTAFSEGVRAIHDYMH